MFAMAGSRCSASSPVGAAQGGVVPLVSGVCRVVGRWFGGGGAGGRGDLGADLGIGAAQSRVGDTRPSGQAQHADATSGAGVLNAQLLQGGPDSLDGW
jgi:hypothetical protein